MGVQIPVYNKDKDSWACPQSLSGKYYTCGQISKPDRAKLASENPDYVDDNYLTSTCLLEDPVLREKLENTEEDNICYDQNAFKTDNENNCPITFIKFLPKDSILYDKDPEKYTQVPFTDDLKIIYSKKTKNRPLTQFRISETAPCMDDFWPISYHD